MPAGARRDERTGPGEFAELTGESVPTYLVDNMSELHRVCDVKALEPGKGRTFTVAGKCIALFNLDGTFHAIESECTHEGAPLANGPIRGTGVFCPWHGAEFDITTGEALSPPADHPVSVFRVIVAAGEVKVELP